LLPPQFARFDWNLNGRNSSVRIGDLVQLASEPIKNPVTGQTESVKIVHETGFIFKEAEVTNAREIKAAVGELQYNYANKAGFVTKIHYAN
jgi:hypothetical protein